MTTPEANARKEIDKQLLATGWILQNISGMNIMAGVGVAVREFPLTTGEADDALYVDGKVVITTIQRLYSMLQGDEEFDTQNEEQSFYEDDLMGGSATMSVCEKPVGYNQQVRSTVFRRNPGTISPEGSVRLIRPRFYRSGRGYESSTGSQTVVQGLVASSTTTASSDLLALSRTLPEFGTTNTRPLEKKAIRQNMKAFGFELPVGGKR